ncbi:hypothetical protein L227DRAFT_377456 [Lentinus tigrinus ALCF2SS1-6]|uniref:F-box domain-containing protein n=1 Tax=Lentinus tigrinus ALCF2SS1-6 TaxID=1328759 RepID=A0A5C2RQL4_9APHY|nr:hypothetical protein L227DRAFT_377456 [Lentinus tigrinus ALCF2SS1-6]
MVVLPPELIYEVLNNFSEKDEDARSTCALISRDWLACVRSRRFSQVLIRIGPGGSGSSTNPRVAIEKFYEVLDAWPPAASHVKSFTLERPRKLFRAVPSNGCSGFEFSRLSNLRQLHLINICFPSLTYLFDVLASTPALEELVLEDVSSTTEYYPASGVRTRGTGVNPPSLPLCKLKELRLPRVVGLTKAEPLAEHDVTALATGLLAANALASLRTLDVTYGTITTAGWLPALPHLSHTLQTLTVRVNGPTPPESCPYHHHTQRTLAGIGSCTNLRSLTILHHGIPESPGFMAGLADAALSGSDRQPQPLERLTLVFICPAEKLQSVATQAQFSKLASVLCRKVRFPAFSRLFVRVEEPRRYTQAQAPPNAADEATWKIKAMLVPFIEARVGVDIDVVQEEH